MNLLISIRSEILKTRRTASFYLTLIMAAVIPVIFFITICFDGISPESIKDPFNAMFKVPFQLTAFVIFPLFVVMICTLLPQIEYKNNTWKQVLASPQTKANVFAAKFLSIHRLILLFLLANHFFMLLLAVVTHFIEPGLKLLLQPVDAYTIVSTGLTSYVSLLAISAIQFWIGLRSKNFIVPIAIGLAFWFVGTFMVLEAHSVYANYFPYSFHVFAAFTEQQAEINSVRWTSVGYAILFLSLGFLDFRARRISS